MDGWREKLNGLRERWDGLSPRARLAALAGVGVAIAAAVLIWAHGSEPTYGVLFGNLAQQDAARIVERLRAMNVDYQLENGGTTIRVPEEAVHETRLTLANEGLPSGGGVGFEIFDTQRFGESDFSEQVQFRRALEGELARTIGHLAGVQRARVHLVLPERSLFTTDDRPASASVALHLRPGWRLREEQVQGVTHLVASSVPGLEPAEVTLVDGDGRPLSGTGGGEEPGSGQADELRERIERSRQRAVQQLLDASLGPGAAVVRVSADVDMARREQLQETYDPERSATRSFEITEERNGDENAPTQGIPGAASNLPGGPAAEREEAQAGLARRTERRNFEVTKTVVRAVRPVGRLERLTVAVVVDGRWSGEGEAREFTPRDEEELARIRALVATAAGIDEERGDRVTVECVPFAGAAEAGPEAEAHPLEVYEPYLPWAAAAAALLLLLLVAFVVWLRRRARKKRERALEAEREKQLGEGADELPTPRALVEETEETREERAATVAQYEQLRALALEVVRRDPALGARVVRGWLAEDATPAEKEAA